MMIKDFNKRAIALLVMLCILVSCISITLINAKYAGMDLINDLRLILQGKTPQMPDTDYVEGEELVPTHSAPGAYHVVYVSYNGEKNVVVAEDVYTATTDIATIRGETTNAADNCYMSIPGCEFLGWSTTGIVSYTEKNGVEDYSNNATTLYKNNRVSVAKLISERSIINTLCSATAIDFSSAEFVCAGESYTPVAVDHPGADTLTHTYIFLYDMYRGGPTLEIQPHEDMLSEDGTLNRTVLVNPYAWMFLDGVVGNLDALQFSENPYVTGIYSDGNYAYLTGDLCEYAALSESLDKTDSIPGKITQQMLDEIARIAEAAGQAAMNGTEAEKNPPSLFSPPYDDYAALREALYTIYRAEYDKVYADSYMYSYEQVYATVFSQIVPSVNGGNISYAMATLYTDVYARLFAEIVSLGMSGDTDAFVFIGAAAEVALAKMAEFGDTMTPEEAFTQAIIFARLFSMVYALSGRYGSDSTEEFADEEAYVASLVGSAEAVYAAYTALIQSGKTSVYAQGHVLYAMFGILSDAAVDTGVQDLFAATYERMMQTFDPIYSLMYAGEYTEMYFTLSGMSFTPSGDETAPIPYSDQALDIGAQIYAEWMCKAAEMGSGSTEDAQAAATAAAKAGADRIMAGSLGAWCTETGASLFEGGVTEEHERIFALAYAAITFALGETQVNDAQIAEMVVNYFDKLNQSGNIRFAQGYSMGYACLKDTVYAEYACAASYIRYMNMGYSPAISYVLAMNFVNDCLQNGVPSARDDILSCYFSLRLNESFTASGASGVSDIEAEVTKLTPHVLEQYNAAVEGHSKAYADAYIEIFIELVCLGLYSENKNGVLNSTTAQTYAHMIAAKYTELAASGKNHTEICAYMERYAYAVMIFGYTLVLNTYDSIRLAEEYVDMYSAMKARGYNDTLSEAYAKRHVTLHYDLVYVQGYEETLATAYMNVYFDKMLHLYPEMWDTAFVEKYNELINSAATEEEAFTAAYDHATAYASDYIVNYCMPYAKKSMQLTEEGNLSASQIAEYCDMYTEVYLSVAGYNGCTHRMADVLATGVMNAYALLVESGRFTEDEASAYVEKYAFLYSYAIANGKSEVYAEGYAESSLWQYVDNYQTIKNTLTDAGFITQTSTEEQIKSAVDMYINVYATAYAEKYEMARHDGEMESTAKTIAQLYAAEYIECFAEQFLLQFGQEGVTMASAMDYAYAYAKAHAQGKGTVYAEHFAWAYVSIPTLEEGKYAGLSDAFKEMYAAVYAQQYVELSATLSGNDLEAAAGAYIGTYVEVHMGILMLGNTLEQATVGTQAFFDAYDVKYEEFRSDYAALAARMEASEYAYLYMLAYLNRYDTAISQSDSDTAADTAAQAYAWQYMYFLLLAYDSMADDSTLDVYGDAIFNWASVYAKYRADLIAQGTPDTGARGAAALAETYISAYFAAYVQSLDTTEGNLFNKEAFKTDKLTALEGTYTEEAYAEMHADKYAQCLAGHAYDLCGDTYVDMYNSVYEEKLAELGGTLPEGEEELAKFFDDVNKAVSAQNLAQIEEKIAAISLPFADMYSEAFMQVYLTVYDYMMSKDGSDATAAETTASEFASLFESKFYEVYDAKYAQVYSEEAKNEALSVDREMGIMAVAYIYAQGYAFSYLESLGVVRYLAGETSDAVAYDRAAQMNALYEGAFNKTLASDIKDVLYFSLVLNESTETSNIEMQTILANCAAIYAQRYVSMYTKQCLIPEMTENQICTPQDLAQYAAAYADYYSLMTLMNGAYGDEYEELAIKYAYAYAMVVMEYGLSEELARVYSFGYCEGFFLESGIWSAGTTTDRNWTDIYNKKLAELVDIGDIDNAEELAAKYADGYMQAYLHAYADTYAYEFSYDVYEYSMGMSVLLLGMSIYGNLQYYCLTSETTSLTFRVHAGLTITSGADDAVGTYVNSQDNKTQNVYLYLFDTSDAALPSEGNETRYIGSPLTAEQHLTLYAYDTTPSDVEFKQSSNLHLSYNPLGNIEIEIPSPECFVTGTMITLADGSTKPVEELTESDILRVYDHENGCYTYAPALLIDFDGNSMYKIAHLEFSDGEVLELINERGLFDITLNKYVYITADNCEEFVGHLFAKETDSAGGFEAVELINAYKTVKFTGCYSVVSTYYINHFINGYLTVPGGYHWFVNYFEYGDGTPFENGDSLAYNEEKMAQDIATYGLLTAEEITAMAPELLLVFSEEEIAFLFDNIFPAKYLKVVVGKGLVTFDEVLEIVKSYIIGRNLSDSLRTLR